VLGRIGADPVVASETCALDLLGASFERDVLPGELIIAGADGLSSYAALAPRRKTALCLFEYFYLARPDTRLEGMEVYGARVAMGAQLAREAPVSADMVVAVPDSGTPAAIGFARESGIPFAEALIKNRYVHRTFIQPEPGMREQGIRIKFNPLGEVAGKRLIVVDDSVVRGATTRQIVQMLFGAGAAEVHLRISSPPVISPCFYGIDLADEEQMIASSRDVEEICAELGASSLAYLSLEGLLASTGRPASTLCTACLTRDYPTRIPSATRKARFEQAPLLTGS
jgi:amidophosphoribosyltransferase